MSFRDGLGGRMLMEDFYASEGGGFLYTLIHVWREEIEKIGTVER